MDKDIAAINKEAQEIIEVDEKETEAPLQDDNGMQMKQCCVNKWSINNLLRLCNKL